MMTRTLPACWRRPGEPRKERRKRELGLFLQTLSRRRPLVLFLDDVHLGRPPRAWTCWPYLGGKCAGLSLLLLLAYRPSDLELGQHPFGPVKLSELQGPRYSAARLPCRS